MHKGYIASTKKGLVERFWQRTSLFRRESPATAETFFSALTEVVGGLTITAFSLDLALRDIF